MFVMLLYMFIWKSLISKQLSLVTFTEIYILSVSFIFFLIFDLTFYKSC